MFEDTLKASKSDAMSAHIIFLDVNNMKVIYVPSTAK